MRNHSSALEMCAAVCDELLRAFVEGSEQAEVKMNLLAAHKFDLDVWVADPASVPDHKQWSKLWEFYAIIANPQCEARHGLLQRELACAMASRDVQGDLLQDRPLYANMTRDKFRQRFPEICIFSAACRAPV